MFSRYTNPRVRICGQIEQNLSRSMFSTSITIHLALTIVVDVIRNLLSQTIYHRKGQTTFVSHQAYSRLLDNTRKNLEVLELQLKTIWSDHLILFNWLSEYICAHFKLPFRIEGRYCLWNGLSGYNSSEAKKSKIGYFKITVTTQHFHLSFNI